MHTTEALHIKRIPPDKLPFHGNFRQKRFLRVEQRRFCEYITVTSVGSNWPDASVTYRAYV